MPPMTPHPSHMIHSWWYRTPIAPMTSPPHQQIDATTPPFLGPTRSSHPPQSAAAEPRNTKKSVNVHPRSLIFQSQVVTVSCAKKLRSLGQSTEAVMPTAFDNGSQNTENP